jgi:tetratricopeptide (TPR) repeat protein
MANEQADSASAGEQLYISALVAASENDQTAQREALEQLVALFPHDERTHVQLGNFLNGQQDFSGAVEQFTQATVINPEFAGAFNALGYAHRSLDDLDSARSAFEEYVALIPDEANPYDSLAELLMEMGNYDESIETYRKALEINPYFALSYQGINVNYSLKGEPELAQEAADQMLAAARNFSERQAAMFREVTSHLFAGDTAAAMDICDVLMAEAGVQGNHAAMGRIADYMGDIMMIAGDTAKAEEYFDAALDHRLQANINEANKTRAARVHLFKTAITAMIGDNGEAAASRTAEYRAAAEANGTAFEKRRASELSGYLAMFNEENEAAAAHFDKASQFNPIVLYWSAVVNRELGNMNKARDLADRAANRNTLSVNLPFFRADAIKLLEELSAE